MKTTMQNEITMQEQKNLDEMSNFVIANIGTILDNKYEITREIARGGMGIVYEAYQKNPHKRVAIKVILAEKIDPIQIKRFQKEIEANFLLSHPNVVKVYDSGIFHNYPYIVMEYIEGVDICTYVRQHKEKDWKLCARLIYETALGLEYIHSQKMIHRDIKPSNIIVNSDGSPIILDLGLVKFNRTQSYNLTKSGEIIGTIEYMPIEQVQGRGQADARTDVYSLGLVLYELLTGQRAYTSDNIVESFYKIIYYYPPLPRKINPKIPKILEEIIIHATEKQKEKRYASAGEFANALKQYLDGITTKATSRYTYYKKRLWFQRNKNKVITCCIALLLVGIAIIGTPKSNEPPIDPNEQYQLGLTHYKEKDYDQAFECFKKSANKNCISAWNMLGLIYYKKQNYNNAYDWWSQSAKQNYPKSIITDYKNDIIKAQYNLGCKYYKKDSKKAFVLFEQSANQGYKDAQYSLATMYYKGEYVTKNFEKAFDWFEKSAIQDHKDAQYNLATMYYKSVGITKNYKKALEWFEKSAIQNHKDAQYSLATMYYNGVGVTKDLEKAFYWYEKSAKQNHKDAQNNLGFMYYNGVGVTKDLEKAFYWYEKSAIQNHKDAQYSLATMYYNGVGVTKDLEKAFYWYEKSAIQNHKDAQNNLGFMYANGQGVAKDEKKARDLFEKSANQGNKNAQYNLATMYYIYYKSYGYTEKQGYKKAHDLFEKSANQGNKNAQYNLGLMYYNGRGGDKDTAKAFDWWKKSTIQKLAKDQYNLELNKDEIANAQYQLGLTYYKNQDFEKAFVLFEQSTNQGNKDAQNNLGIMYYKGEYVKQDFKHAFDLFEKSANQENIDAQNNLGLMYYKGEYVKQDFKHAFDLFEKSANKKHAPSQYSLGLMYYNGEGIPQNLSNANYWFGKAASQGYPNAQLQLGLMYYNGEGVKKDDTMAWYWLKQARDNTDIKVSQEATKILEDMKK